VLTTKHATQDAFDTIDLSENELTSLDNVPLLPRLRTLMLARNRINVRVIKPNPPYSSHILQIQRFIFSQLAIFWLQMRPI
jgi:hypothetical protein